MTSGSVTCSFWTMVFQTGMVVSSLSHLSVANELFYSDAMDQLGCRRYCCRRMIMTHVDLIEKLLRYVPCYFGTLVIVAHFVQLQFRRERSLQGSSISQSISHTSHESNLSSTQAKAFLSQNHTNTHSPLLRGQGLGRLFTFCQPENIGGIFKFAKEETPAS